MTELEKMTLLIGDIRDGINYARECIEDYEFACDGIDDYHRGMLRAYENVLHCICMIDREKN